MTETDVQSNESLNRRTIVKGGMWTQPVIAAAVAAPAASASTLTALVAFSPSTSGQSWPAIDGGSSSTILGTGPSSFTVQNSEGAIPGNVTGTITIAPNGGVSLGERPKGLGIAAIAGVIVTGRDVFGGSDSFLNSVADTTKTTFSYTGGVSSSGLVAFNITFGYTAGGSFLSLGLLQSYTATLVLKDGNGIQIGQPATSTLSSMLAAQT